MGKVIRWLKDRLPTQRRLIQLYAALLHNAHVKGFITGSIYEGQAKTLCMPGLNCYSCPGAVGSCPLGALQNAISASRATAPVYVLGILMLLGLTLGRTICGFLCPAGLMQELLHKIPTPKVKKGRLTRVLSWLKYVILAVFVLVLPLWYGLQRLAVPAFCKYICPVGTAEGALGLLAHPANEALFGQLGLLFTRKMAILLLIVAACVFVYRAFCRFLCPLGAIYGLFARVAVIGVKVDADSCTDCGRCVSRCRMDVRRVGDHECIHCGECISACPARAISLRAGRIVLHGPEIAAAPEPVRRRIRSGRRAAWAVALAVLAAALVFFNLPAGEEKMPPASPPTAASEMAMQDASVLPTPSPEAAAAVGSSVGMRAPDFTVPLYGGGSFTLSEHLGKTVIVNFWATWCGPCIQELPHFDALAAANPQDVVVVAVHSHLVTEDVERFLEGFGYGLPFALDETGDVIRSYGGSLTLPQTVVIDPQGMITYNSVGSLNAARLEKLLREAQGGAEEALSTEAPPSSTSTATPRPDPLQFGFPALSR